MHGHEDCLLGFVADRAQRTDAGPVEYAEAIQFALGGQEITFADRQAIANLWLGLAHNETGASLPMAGQDYVANVRLRTAVQYVSNIQQMGIARDGRYRRFQCRVSVTLIQSRRQDFVAILLEKVRRVRFAVAEVQGVVRSGGRNRISLGIGDAQGFDDIARPLGYLKRNVHRWLGIANL